MANEKSGGINISAGGNVTLTGAVAIGDGASASIQVLSDGDRGRLRESLGQLRELVARDPGVDAKARDEIVKEIEGVKELAETKDVDVKKVKARAIPLVERINGMCDEFQHKSGVFECLNMIIGVLALSATLVVR